MGEGDFICRECGWKGSSPIVKSWDEPSSTHTGPHGEDVYVPAHSGSMEKCPRCEKIVRTQKDWERQDKEDYWVTRILWAVFGLLTIFVLLSFAVGQIAKG